MSTTLREIYYGIRRTVKTTGKYMVNIIPNLLGWEVFMMRRNSRRYHVFDSHIMSAYWNRDDEIADYENSLHRTGMDWSDNISKRGRYYSLYQNAVLTLDRNIGKGDVAECGVWQGHSAHMVASILKKRGFTNKFFIFDSFQGLSEITPLDVNELFPLSEKQIEEQRSLLACSEDVVRSNLSEFDFMEYYAGWIPSRFDEVEDRKFILVHLDVDLYQPFRDSLMFFYPRLVEGGVIVFDDYGLTQFPGAKTAVDEAVEEFHPTLFYKIPTGGAFLIK